MGSSSGPQHDQELDSVLVGPVPIGTSRFVLQTNGPDPRRIPADDILGATVSSGALGNVTVTVGHVKDPCFLLRQVVMVICSYRNREFIRVGYWVANTYALPLPEGMCVVLWIAHQVPPTGHQESKTLPSS